MIQTKPRFDNANPKIDCYQGPRYLYSTNSFRTCRDALAYFQAKYAQDTGASPDKARIDKRLR